jgi:hypothetical protein
MIITFFFRVILAAGNCYAVLPIEKRLGDNFLNKIKNYLFKII